MPRRPADLCRRIRLPAELSHAAAEALAPLGVRFAVMALRMRQSLAELERAFHEESQEDRDRRDALRRAAVDRSRQRTLEKRHRHGSMRFGVLVAVLVATAVLVTIAMFEILYMVMG